MECPLIRLFENRAKRYSCNQLKTILDSSLKRYWKYSRVAHVLRLGGDTSSEVKRSGCVWLQKILSSYQSTLPELYSKIAEPTREKFKKEIFIILHGEKDSEVRKQISDTIGEVGGSLLANEEVAKSCNTTNDKLWPELVSARSNIRFLTCWNSTI